ncbi:unnamed protein product [Didymodactylos carnosus]|uniref:Uncharacterized protein n=1 Tax=Didymodactylos carnosus TaxID=1234261 RepID=A0A814ZZY3_9BILA|nr:unnamed protein product [Didymodactylos carnosus]CAF4018599.1 unnamed protein product [Didymodactylos carnosus]
MEKRHGITYAARAKTLIGYCGTISILEISRNEHVKKSHEDQHLFKLLCLIKNEYPNLESVDDLMIALLGYLGFNDNNLLVMLVIYSEFKILDCLTLFLIRVIGSRVSFYKATLNENLIINVVFKNDDPSEVTPVLRYAPPNLSKSPSRLFPWSLDLVDAEN